MTAFKIIQTDHIDFSSWVLVSSPRRDQVISISFEQCCLKPPKGKSYWLILQSDWAGWTWMSCLVTPCCIPLSTVSWWIWSWTRGQQVPGIFLPVSILWFQACMWPFLAFYMGKKGFELRSSGFCNNDSHPLSPWSLQHRVFVFNESWILVLEICITETEKIL